jgi:hypothetical protein
MKIKTLSCLLAFLGTTILSDGKVKAYSEEDDQGLNSPKILHQKLEEDKVDPAMEIFPLLIPIICAIMGDSNSEEKDKNAQLVSEIEETKNKINNLVKVMGDNYKKLVPSLTISDRLKTSRLEGVGNFLLDIEPNTSLITSIFRLPKELDNLQRDYSDNKKTLEEYREALKKLNVENILQLQTRLEEKLKKINEMKDKLPDDKKDKRSPSLNIEKEEQKQLIGANVSATGAEVKVAMIDSYFDPHQHINGLISPATLKNYENKDKAVLAEKAAKFGLNHANYTAGIFHSVASGAELQMIDLRNEIGIQDKELGNKRVIAAIDEAIKNKVDFLNISLRISPDSEKEKDSAISEEIKKAFLRAKNEGIGIIKSIGNDNELIGHTAYTRSLAQLVEEMDGNMILVAAAQYDEDWQLEKIARYGGDRKIGGSNYAGFASEYTLTAPGKNIYVGSIEEGHITSGTSMATPLVAAAAALVKSAHPNLSSGEVLSYLLHSARKHSYNSVGEAFAYLPAGKYGQGIVNVENALELINSQKK